MVRKEQKGVDSALASMYLIHMNNTTDHDLTTDPEDHSSVLYGLEVAMSIVKKHYYQEHSVLASDALQRAWYEILDSATELVHDDKLPVVIDEDPDDETPGWLK